MSGIKISFCQLAIFAIAFVILDGAYAKSPSRVVGGEDGNIGEFPYIASLKKNGKHVCGATIIGTRHVLTAGHCIDGVSGDPSKDMTVTTGTNVALVEAGATHAIKTVTIHPDFVNNITHSWQNDLAIIALADTIVLDTFTQLAGLPEEDTPAGIKCIASGWGDMSFPRGIRPNNVRTTPMTTVSNAVCSAHETPILSTHLCAFEKLGVGLCVGDSGGPLLADGKVVGIASFVRPCARGLPDVFTRVYSYVDFIKKVMAST